MIILLFTFVAAAFEPHCVTRATPAYLAQATGELTSAPMLDAPWPVQLESIGHTNASYQNYGGTPYFHHGLDIRAAAGSDVLSSTAGKIVNIENYAFGDLYWEVAVLDDEGFIWQYHHVEKRSIPAEIHAAFRSGERIAQGTKLGVVVDWPISTFGERYHHIHLNILDGSRRYVSPFLKLAPLGDDQSPQVKSIGLLQDGRALSGTRVKGRYSLYAEIYDLILHDKFIVPPHSISVSVDGGGHRTVWDFSMLPGGADEEALVDKFYVKSMVCGNYQCRRPVIDLGFGGEFPLAAGPHELTLRAWDFVGNAVEHKFSWIVE
jgi:hypothetical protein